MKAELVKDCVHCGFCLPTCPTYGPLWQEEMDSPRGRIYLMGGLLDGSIPLSDTTVEHFDRCLGCVACVTSCPSGVRYGTLIEETRAYIETNYERSPADRLLRSAIFRVFTSPARLRAALALAPMGRLMLLPRRLASLIDLAPPWRSYERPPAVTPARGERVGRVGLLTGCVQSVVFGDVNAATARVLAADGFEVVVPQAQGCCGALFVHGGRREEGRARARHTIAQFEAAGVDLVAVNAAGCGSTLKEYVHLLEDDPAWAERARAFSAKVRDVHELLSDPLAQRAPRHPLALRVAFQDSCHLAHAQGIRHEPRAALDAIPGVTVAEPAEQAICCGSAGLYNIIQPEAARELGERKARHVLDTEPDAYASANPGCLIQVGSQLRRLGRQLPIFHPVELVDASIRGVPVDRLLATARR